MLPLPGLVWSSGSLSILRVAARRVTVDDHFILLRDLIPIAAPFSSCSAALRYAEHEWIEGAPVAS